MGKTWYTAPNNSLSGLWGMVLNFPASFPFYPWGLSRLGPACPPAAGWQGVESGDCGTGGYLQLQCSRDCEQQQGEQPDWFSHANCWLLVNTSTEESAHFCPSSFPAVPSPAERMKACICRVAGHCTTLQHCEGRSDIQPRPRASHPSFW